MGKYAKAIIGALIVGLGVIVEGLTDGSLSASEWITAIILALTTLGGVYVVPNSGKKQPTA